MLLANRRRDTHFSCRTSLCQAGVRSVPLYGAKSLERERERDNLVKLAVLLEINTAAEVKASDTRASELASDSDD